MSFSRLYSAVLGQQLCFKRHTFAHSCRGSKKAAQVFVNRHGVLIQITPVAGLLVLFPDSCWAGTVTGSITDHFIPPQCEQGLTEPLKCPLVFAPHPKTETGIIWTLRGNLRHRSGKKCFTVLCVQVRKFADHVEQVQVATNWYPWTVTLKKRCEPSVR